MVPTHTFATAPPLDLLFVPGGLGTRGSNPVIEEVISYIRNTYPQLGYLITVCTGAGLAARAGVLDGKRATTNKMAWTETTGLGVNVDWVPRARWVVDGNVWSSSGVSAGIDVTLAWIGETMGGRWRGISRIAWNILDMRTLVTIRLLACMGFELVTMIVPVCTFYIYIWKVFTLFGNLIGKEI